MTHPLDRIAHPLDQLAMLNDWLAEHEPDLYWGSTQDTATVVIELLDRLAGPVPEEEGR